ncbi:nuclear transport factor 2 family protein [Flavobacterium aquicola]|uniref:Uncharacterized protein DUF4440 n=1 Tax=Flavobacterium aquicola TaxID=1682742 RepID=A0A3E0EPG3_9FLAO|nr:nuclear transport factor 2 family protein [Flavobacterium aquicola]REH00062.1 uncharacterized protein DUF4440 [Flavobacterium aquicola]
MEKSEIVNAENELLSAIKNIDISVLERVLHDNLLFNLPNGQTITKDADLAGYRAGKMKIDFLEASNQVINIIGDSAVVCVSILLKGTYDNSPLDGNYRYIRVWKQFDDGLKVIAGSCVAFLK